MKRKKEQKWAYREKSLLATRAGLHVSYVSDIFNRKVPCNKYAALKIIEILKVDMGLIVSLEDLVFNLETDNPLFGPKITKEGE